MKFEIRDLEEILGDIEMAKGLYGDRIGTVFIGDSNSLVAKTEMLVKVLNALFVSFPHIQRVTSYARAKTIAKKSLEDLIKIRQAGLNRLHVGLETGDRELLREIQKGATPEEMIEAGQKAKKAGFEYSLYVLLGIGGEEKWEQHARGTAEVLNQIDPHFIRVRTFIPQPNSPIYEAMIKGFQIPFTRNNTKGNETPLEGALCHLSILERPYLQSPSPPRETPRGQRGNGSDG